MRALIKEKTQQRKNSVRHRQRSMFENASWPAKCLGFCVVALAIVYGLFAGGHFSHLGSEITKGARGAVDAAGLSIREIKITGNKRASRASILKAAGFDVGTPIMSFKAGEVRDRLQKLDWIETARVVRLLPDRVQIEVSERKPFALWQLDGQIRVIDRTGKRLNSLSPADYPNFIQFIGKGAGSHSLDLMSELNQYPALKSQVKAAIRVADRRWTLKLTKDIDILLPENDLASALGEFERLEGKYHLLGKKIAIIDMRLPEKITIRLREVRHNKEKAALSQNFGVQSL